MKNSTPRIVTGADTLFSELGVEDAQIMKLRAYLLVGIKRYIEASDLTHSQLASKLKTRRPVISAAINNKLQECSIERLIKVIISGGGSVSISVTLPNNP